MISGIAKRWNPSERWGFIESDDGEDYFLHVTKIRSGQSLGNNSRVKFDVSQGQRGPETENVTVY